MAWKIQHIHNNPLQNTYVLVNDDKGATLTTDYHAADKLARDTFGPVTLASKHYNLSDYAARVYASQAY